MGQRELLMRRTDNDDNHWQNENWNCEHQERLISGRDRKLLIEDQS